ncbi:ATP-binding cassette domain-containing protein [Pseudooceanicola sp. 216_PA32_1]|uniref:ATP-binding cassette domain-containing protein n=1 Tax=Pseudooceanicola pacificus TaxID=2676438 RepID=A0A844WB22_9RHOB|nr:ABC transporter ATP-binding protein [Pseudooceanicola pacificus]MWB77052.1 ATP-binding cassette domain-containing protein [Pseudooceanicola pacificus]
MTEVPSESRPARPIMALGGLEVARFDASRQAWFRLSVPELTIRAGERICLVGRSGSGKTTLLEVLGLLSCPDALDRYDLSPYGDGRLLSVQEPILAGQATVLSAIRSRTMGFVLQDGGLLPYLSVRDNALLAAELAGQRGREIGERIEALAAAMGIERMLDRLPAGLSGGQRQRSAVLRAMASAPVILLADEPTAALDGATANEVMQVMVNAAKATGATLVMVSHNEDLATRYGFTVRRLETHTGSGGETSTLAPLPQQVQSA